MDDAAAVHQAQQQQQDRQPDFENVEESVSELLARAELLDEQVRKHLIKIGLLKDDES